MRQALAPLLLLHLLSSCSSPDLATFAREHTTREEREFAENYLQLLAKGQTDSAATLLAPNLRSDTAARTLLQVGALLREARLDSLHVIGVNVHDNLRNDVHELNLSYEVPTTTGRWLTTNVATRSVRGRRMVIGFSAHRIPSRLEEINAFTLADKSGLHFLWLALAGLIPLMTLTTAVRVVRANGMARRWLWAVAALIAAPAFVLNWTTGQPSVANNLFVLFGGAFARPGAAAPWSVTFALPIGTAVAYLRLRAWRNAQAAARAVLRRAGGRGQP